MSNKPLDDVSMASARDESRAMLSDEASSHDMATSGGALSESLVIPAGTSAMIELPAVLDRVEDFTSSELCHIFEELGLSRDQAIFTYLHNLMGYSQREVSALVGWSSKHAESIRRTLDRPRARRAIAESGLLAATAARWPGPQLGQIVTLFFPECPQIASYGLMVDAGARHPLISRRSTKRIFTMLPEIRVPADEVAAEVKRLMDSNNWGHTIEWTRAWCHDRIATRLKLAQETAELSRMEALSASAAAAEFEAAEMAMLLLRERKFELARERKALLKTWREKAGRDSIRDTTSFIASGIPAIEDQLAQATDDHLAACWTYQALQGVVAFHKAQADQKDLVKLVERLTPEVVKLGVKVAAADPVLIAALPNNPVGVTMRALAGIGNLRHEAKVA